MIFFIDFDNTLFSTPKLLEDMFNSLSKFISENCCRDYEEVKKNISSKFGRKEDQIFDIYELVKYFSTKYNYNEKEAIKAVNETIFNCEKYIYDDSIEFLKFLKNRGHKTYILSYNESKIYFQTIKIAGTGLLDYVDGLITTTILKGNMPFDFSKCVFIDDKPEELIAIYKNKPINVYRIRRKNSKYSNLKIEEPIPEFENLKELTEELNKL